MFWITDILSVEIVIGVIIGLSLPTIKNFIFRRDLNRINKSVQKSNSRTNQEYKIALLVRNDLKMGKGKVAAQVRYILR